MGIERSRRLSLTCAVGLVLAPAVAASPIAAQTLHYRTYAADSDSTLWRFSVGLLDAGSGSGALEATGTGATVVLWRSESGDSHEEEFLVQADGNTLEWFVRFDERSTDYHGVRTHDRLGVSGSIDGLVVNRDFVLGADPLYANVALGLATFVRSGAREIDFWAFRPDDASMIQMNARRGAVETLAIEGRAVPAVLVRIAPTGWRGFFYSRRFWFRASDGALLRTDERDGRVTELVGDG